MDANSVPYSVFSDFVLDHYRPPARRIGTFRKAQQAVKEFGEVCPTVADIGPGSVARWLPRHQDRSMVTNFSVLRAFAAACKIASHMIEVSPFVARSPRRWFPEADFPDEPTGRKFHTEREVCNVLALADLEARAGTWHARRLRAVVYTLVFLGARRNEVLGMRVDDVDLTDRLVYIRPNARRRLKTKSSRAILPIPPRLADVLAWWTPQTDCEWLFPGAWRMGPWLDGGPKLRPTEVIKELGKRAGVDGFTPLSIRHTFATLAEGWGWGDAMIQRFLRHTTPITQQGYRHAHLAQMADAADRIRFGRAG